MGTGGVSLRTAAGPQRELWLQWLRELLPPDAPVRRIPLGIHDDRLLGGLDLAATLQLGRPVAQRGVLAEADGGVVILPMAERLTASTAARLVAVLDTREVVTQRHGLGMRHPARLGVIALDEGITDDERLPRALLDRLAFHVSLEQVPARLGLDDAPAWHRGDVSAARVMLARVTASHDMMQALCAAALALGVDSIRAPLSALRVARAAAALDGCTEVEERHAELAARMVLAPRATMLPLPPPPEEPDDSPAETQAAPEEPQDQEEPGDVPPADNDGDDSSDANSPSGSIEDLVLEAAQAAIPAGLLAALKMGQGSRLRAPSAGRCGLLQQSRLRGRPSGVRRGEPRAGVRLNVIETLRAAAPWQAARRRELLAKGDQRDRLARVQIRREDFHITRFKQRSETTTVFVVDASGSAALHRLAEAKGAVELLLADCYVRRDSVAVLAFRGATAELLLPPTRSLVRAKRSLAGLPGGGGTPLAAGIDAAAALADAVRRRGETPVIVLLTDGRANIARDGTPGRVRATEDALAAARRLRGAGLTALLLDTSPQPQQAGRDLAQQMGATYLPLPHAGAAVLSQAVRLATAPVVAPR